MNICILLRRNAREPEFSERTQCPISAATRPGGPTTRAHYQFHTHGGREQNMRSEFTDWTQSPTASAQPQAHNLVPLRGEKEGHFLGCPFPLESKRMRNLNSQIGHRVQPRSHGPRRIILILEAKRQRKGAEFAERTRGPICTATRPRGPAPPT